MRQDRPRAAIEDSADAPVTARSTRRQAVLAGALGAVAIASPASAAAPADADVIGELLQLERRLIAIYDAALARDLLDAAAARQLRDQEREHATGLERALAGMGVRAPADDGPSTLALPSRERFAEFALRVEREAVDAYVDAIANLRNPRLVQPLGSIAASEGQHEVVLDLLSRRAATPGVG